MPVLAVGVPVPGGWCLLRGVPGLGGVSAPRGGVPGLGMPGLGMPGLGGAWSQGVPASGPGGYLNMQ